MRIQIRQQNLSITPQGCSILKTANFKQTKQQTMETKFFKDCKTLQEVKQLYRELCKVHHPDKGGDTATMQIINCQYTSAINIIANNGTLSEEQANNEILNAEQYKQAINAILNLEGLQIEICGGWIWVGGNTYQHKTTLKQNGFYFASKKCQWYFRSAEYKTSSKKSHSMDEIRAKYGSQQITGNYQKRIY